MKWRELLTLSTLLIYYGQPLSRLFNVVAEVVDKGLALSFEDLNKS
jgi:hypothetical protein